MKKGKEVKYMRRWLNTFVLKKDLKKVDEKISRDGASGGKPCKVVGGKPC